MDIWHGRGQTWSLVGSGRLVSKFHYTDPGTLSATRPDQTRLTDKVSPYMSRLSGQVYDQTGDPSGPWVWSGRVRAVELRNDTTRPDQRQSLVEFGHNQRKLTMPKIRAVFTVKLVPKTISFTYSARERSSHADSYISVGL